MLPATFEPINALTTRCLQHYNATVDSGQGKTYVNRKHLLPPDTPLPGGQLSTVYLLKAIEITARQPHIGTNAAESSLFLHWHGWDLAPLTTNGHRAKKKKKKKISREIRAVRGVCVGGFGKL
jgi:hypothetical protein